MGLFKNLRRVIKHRRRLLQFEGIYSEFLEFTMIPKHIYIENLQLAEKISGISGCVVECGVWRGGMTAGMARILGSRRAYFLFDSFAGLPPAQEVDGENALAWQSNTQAPGYHDNCTASPEFARQAMLRSGATNFHLIEGWFNETLPKFVPPEPIALLRLDADWYDSTMTCMESLFDRVTPGGLIILDDYYAWDGCGRALHDFLSKRSATERIQSHGSVCFLEKKPKSNHPI